MGDEGSKYGFYHEGHEGFHLLIPHLWFEDGSFNVQIELAGALFIVRVAYLFDNGFSVVGPFNELKPGILVGTTGNFNAGDATGMNAGTGVVIGRIGGFLFDVRGADF